MRLTDERLLELVLMTASPRPDPEGLDPLPMHRGHSTYAMDAKEVYSMAVEMIESRQLLQMMAEDSGADSPCCLDHSGGCQNHGDFTPGPCYTEKLRRVLGMPDLPVER